METTATRTTPEDLTRSVAALLANVDAGDRDRPNGP
jgi:hypothetical protein